MLTYKMGTFSYRRLVTVDVNKLRLLSLLFTCIDKIFFDQLFNMATKE